jgi:hypothetical protein
MYFSCVNVAVAKLCQLETSTQQQKRKQTTMSPPTFSRVGQLCYNSIPKQQSRKHESMDKLGVWSQTNQPRKLQYDPWSMFWESSNEKIRCQQLVLIDSVACQRCIDVDVEPIKSKGVAATCKSSIHLGSGT